MERIAALETMVENLHDDLDSVKDDVHAMRGVLEEANLAISKYKGFFGGVVFTVGAIAGVVGAVVASIWHKLAT